MALAAYIYYDQPVTEASPLPVDVDGGGGETITVHVSGAVAAPGLVEVAGNARVADVIAAAGGTTADAVPGLVNLAAPVRDGEQIVVPADVPGDVTPSGVDQSGRVRLNSASPAELEQIPGVGPVLAGRIDAAREARGGFVAVEDLLDVAGIGEAKLAALRDHVTVP